MRRGSLGVCVGTSAVMCWNALIGHTSGMLEITGIGITCGCEPNRMVLVHLRTNRRPVSCRMISPLQVCFRGLKACAVEGARLDCLRNAKNPNTRAHLITVLMLPRM